jgi:hypothetical protein
LWSVYGYVWEHQSACMGTGQKFVVYGSMYSAWSFRLGLHSGGVCVSLFLFVWLEFDPRPGAGFRD